MLGLSRKRTAKSADEPAKAAKPAGAPMPEEGPESLLQSFHVLEVATLSLDGIAHSLKEARMLARIASRPEGAAQRGLIARRYQQIKGEIEAKSQEAALDNSDRLMVLLGADDGRQGSLVTRALPASRFESPDEAKAVVKAMDFALKAIDEEATHLREAAGRLSDRLAEGVHVGASTSAKAESAIASPVQASAQRTGKSRKAA